ncbi:MAG: transporter [Rhodospirillaceae bacterium]|nr:transporter [Rhodospirillaceae bacterium]
MKNLIFMSIIILFLQSCAPLVGTIGMVSLGAASKEKGLGTSINDNFIKTKISNLIYKYNKDLIADTKVFVNNGSVLFTGKLINPNDKIEFTKLAWNIRGVNEVNNEIQLTDMTSIKNIARDVASLGEIRARLMSDKSINSLNFSVDVVNDKAYVSGVATSELEMNLVKNHASSARFINEVYNYIILNKDTR